MEWWLSTCHDADSATKCEGNSTQPWTRKYPNVKMRLVYEHPTSMFYQKAKLCGFIQCQCVLDSSLHYITCQTVFYSKVTENKEAKHHFWTTTTPVTIYILLFLFIVKSLPLLIFLLTYFKRKRWQVIVPTSAKAVAFKGAKKLFRHMLFAYFFSWSCNPPHTPWLWMYMYVSIYTYIFIFSL